MLFEFFNKVVFGQKTSCVPERVGLVDRMKALRQRCEDYTSHYTPYIVSLHSKQILEAINCVDELESKLHSMNVYSCIFEKLAKAIYNRYNPSVVYFFNNEVHVVFYNCDDNPELYDGNIHLLMSSITSFATRELDRYLSSQIDFTFVAKYTEFPKEYEVLNFLIWRQFDCRRNNTTLLYKCLHKDEFLQGRLTFDKVNLQTMSSELDALTLKNIERILYGVICKRIHFAPRNHISSFCEPLWQNFSDNYRRFIAST